MRQHCETLVRDELYALLQEVNTPRVLRRKVRRLYRYQGIANGVAADYMRRHGRATWRAVQAGVAQGPSCPKLGSYWQYHGCRYHKGSRTCAEPEHIETCPLPALALRNGNLNQLAYSLFLFIRDLIGGDLADRCGDLRQQDLVRPQVHSEHLPRREHRQIQNPRHHRIQARHPRPDAHEAAEPEVLDTEEQERRGELRAFSNISARSSFTPAGSRPSSRKSHVNRLSTKGALSGRRPGTKASE